MTRSRKSQPNKPPWTRWLAAAFLLTFLLSSALAGFSYVWCIPLGQAKLACCCHAAATADEAAPAADDGAPSVARAPCCESRRFDALAAAEAPRHALPHVAAPPSVELPGPVLDAAPPLRTMPLVVLSPPVPEGRGPPLIPLYKRHARFLC